MSSKRRGRKKSPAPVPREGSDRTGDPSGFAERIQAIVESPSYKLASEDVDFLMRHELRGVRLQLELMKAEIALRRHGIRYTIVVFGGTRIVEAATAQAKIEMLEKEVRERGSSDVLERKIRVARRIAAKSHYYDEARKFGRLVSKAGQDGKSQYVVVTGGGPGIMEAGNRGAYEVGAKSVGFNITLPQEQFPNPYITPNLCFQFHYFAIRKLHFLLRAQALVAFPGGYGTLDELFEALTLIQTGKARLMPVILFGREFWDRVVDLQALAEEGTIDEEDLDLFRYAETAEDAWRMIQEFYIKHPGPRRRGGVLQ